MKIYIFVLTTLGYCFARNKLDIFISLHSGFQFLFYFCFKIIKCQFSDLYVQHFHVDTNGVMSCKDPARTPSFIINKLTFKCYALQMLLLWVWSDFVVHRKIYVEFILNALFEYHKHLVQFDMYYMPSEQ